MQAILIASTLAIGLASSHSSDGAAPSVAEILAAWSRRAESVPCGRVSWTIPAEGRNLFGRFDSQWAAASDASGGEMAGTVVFDQQQARYDSVTFSHADGAAATRRIAEARFRAGLLSAQHAYRDLMPYTVIYSPAQRVHFWHGDAGRYPVAHVLPAGPGVDLMHVPHSTEGAASEADDAADGFSVYLHQLLVAPALLTFRPLLFDRGFSQAEACQMVSGLAPLYEGRVCSVLRVTAAPVSGESSPSAIPAERFYWVDRSRDFIVVRCLFKWDDAVHAQIDIHYEPMDKLGWIPATWSVLRFGSSPQIVQQVVTAQREDMDVQQRPVDDAMGFHFPPRTWVTDRVALRQYLVRDDFSQYEIEGDYRFPAHTHAQLVELAQGGGSVRGKGMRRTLVALVRWPGVLVPLALLSGLLIVGNSVLARWRNARRGRAAGQSQLTSVPRVPP